ncbi:MAG TPA: bifunctional phosphoribosyl-AMP cyclohydrolase/phosphoribosyl-ATP diphosphatase HisIE [Candidatus Baltobacteraceae bacterium]|jgi:phosphoribosyl-ATP pyrophosphohydrolase/phosphoribosyl-AMP cyclohydrolase|nr:bifunctional phosphoribosyl-AMP cyclohydrolase/phosphoribosyl-ATP diphosphatase HisIE [Candidatus Baltobacteraceae bacterium]
MFEDLKWDADGLLPVVLSDAKSGEVLTLAYADREALERTLRERTTWLFSRSRKCLWKKGETSGNVQHVVSVASDCDGDALLYRVIPHGPACHTGARSCFDHELLPTDERGANDQVFARALSHLGETIEQRRGADPAKSYTSKLLSEGVDRICKKIGEEATEVVIAAKNASHAEIVWEVSDLFYHTLVLLAERGVALDDVGAELLRRAR